MNINSVSAFDCSGCPLNNLMADGPLFKKKKKCCKEYKKGKRCKKCPGRKD